MLRIIIQRFFFCSNQKETGFAILSYIIEDFIEISYDIRKKDGAVALRERFINATAPSLSSIRNYSIKAKQRTTSIGATAPHGRG